MAGEETQEPGEKRGQDCSQDSVEFEALLWALPPSLLPPFHFAALGVTLPGRAAPKMTTGPKRLHICKTRNGHIFLVEGVLEPGMKGILP